MRHVATIGTACTCGGSGPVCFAARRADAVFVGRVTAFTSGVEFEVEQAFSGVKPGRITVEKGSDTCAYSFAIGYRYLVYAWRHRSTGALSTSMCSRTRPMSDPHTRADPAAATVVKLKTDEQRQLPPFRLPPLPTDRLITVVVQAPTHDVARETTIFLTGAKREPVAHTGDPLPLRLPFGASYLIEAVAPKGYRIIQPPSMRIMPDDTDKTIEFRVERP
jgi:hypothetical protein